MDAISAIAQFWLAPFLTLLVSVVYFRASSRTLPLGQRLAVSAHGIAITVLYFGAMFLWMSGLARPAYGMPFAYLLLIPIVLISYSLWRFRGWRFVHILQFLNLVSIAWTFFIGSMAVTGDWL